MLVITMETKGITESSQGGAIYFVRHGLREDWENPAWKDTAPNPQDPRLSSAGEQQAREAATFVKSLVENEKVKRIIVSPYTRTCQTATYVADAVNAKLCLEYGVTEFIPNEELTPPSVEELAKQFSRIDTSYKSKMGIPKSESKKFLMERGKQIMKHISETYAIGNKETVIVVTHAAPKIALVRGLIGDPTLQVNCSTCSVSKVVKQENGWKVILNGETSFLSQGAQYGWAFPDEVRMKNKE